MAIIAIMMIIVVAIYTGIKYNNTADSVVIQKKCVENGLSCIKDNACCSKRCVLGTCRKRNNCKYGETSPGICGLSPEDTGLIVSSSMQALQILASEGSSQSSSDL